VQLESLVESMHQHFICHIMSVWNLSAALYDVIARYMDDHCQVGRRQFC